MTPQNAWSLQLIDHIDAVIDGEPLGSTQREGTQRKDAGTASDRHTGTAHSDHKQEPQEARTGSEGEADKTEAQLVDDANKTNFQLASCTLDASAQIYSVRVDSVHKIAYEVLGGLSHAKPDDDDDDDEHDDDDLGGRRSEDAPAAAARDGGDVDAADGEGDGAPEGDERLAGRRAARKGIAATTLDTPENLDAKLQDTLSNADFLFRKTTALMNRGGARSLFLSNCPALYGYEVLLEPTDMPGTASDASKKEEGGSNDDGASKSEEEPAAECGPIVDAPGTTLESSVVLPLIAGRNVDELCACTLLRNYSFARGDIVRADDPDASQETGAASSSSSSQGTALEIPENPEPSAAFALLDDDDDDGNDGNDGNDDPLPGMLDLDGLDDDGGGGEEEEGGGEDNALPHDSQFSFFDPKVLRNWAGPSCWKFPAAKPGPKRARGDGASNSNNNGGSGAGDATETEDDAPRKRARRDRDEVFIDFTTPKKPPRRSLFEPPTKTTTVLSDAALKKHTVEATTLPPDVHYDVSMLSRLFLNPNWHFTERHIAALRRPDAADPAADPRLAGRLLQRGGPMSQEWYECRDAGILPGTSSGALGNEDDDDDDSFGRVDASGDVDFGAALELPDAAPETTAATGEATTTTIGLGELVQAPAVPQVTEVNYARSIKRMDAAAVKGALWKALCRLQPLPPAPQPPAAADAAEPAPRPVPFRALVAMLPALLPPTVLAELTVAFCFVCLLHLCNERGVVLTTAPDTRELLASRRECAPAPRSA